MMGTSHAATGVLTGAAVGALLGSEAHHLFVCAAVGAGAALLPDLDTPSSTVGRSLGHATELVAKGLRGVSRAVYRRTATGVELRAPQDAGHRHLTHTVPAAVVFGLAAMSVSLVPFGAGLVVSAMSAIGLGTVARPWRALGSTRTRRFVALVLALLCGIGSFLGGGPAAWLVGVTVAVGALTHIMGDWLTRSGVPLAWPLVYRGKRWWMFRSPLAFRTGRSKVEVGIRWGSWVGAALLAAASSTPV
ncbi:metal-dependent hydrolase [Nocardiopsis sp. ATB16-24]|uniref:metal-dependent hydrolase n=1 Tax=Nocardiopsis sp. ATB16-24 TaxID=3019555 RepID=UPI002554AAED|nr:metal-dependent hydrolase [Nocardiopsis sp. ATB16-24]